MQQQQNKADHYRKEANRYADLAKAAELDFMGEFFRKTAVRYVLMAEDLERAPERRLGRRRNDLPASINELADVFLRTS